MSNKNELEGVENTTTSTIKEAGISIRWEKLKELFVLTYNQSLAMNKQIDVISNEFKEIIDADEKIYTELCGVMKVSEDHIKDVIDIYKLHTDGAGKPYEDFESYRYFTGVINNTDEKMLESYIAIVSAYTALEDRFAKIMPITIGHLVSLITEYIAKNDLEVSEEQQDIFDTIKQLGVIDGE